MNDRPLPKEQRSRKKGGGLIPALCNIVGTAILLAVIASSMAVTLPRFMGWGIYHVVSGSMEPEIPVGSVIYVEKTGPETIQTGEIIAFQNGDSVIAHRVVKNQVVEGTFTTKGDANAENDMRPVEYPALIGRVTAHYPVLGSIMGLYTSKIGKAYIICFAACGAMFNILAGQLRARRKKKGAV